MRNLAGGLLVTPGQFAPEALPLARAQRIELLDGPTLWPELRLLMPEEQRAAISAPSQARARQQVLLAWGFGLVMGALLFVVMQRRDAGEVAAPAPSVASVPVVAPRARITPLPAATTAPQTSNAPAPDDEAALQRRRKAVAEAISSLPMVGTATWETQSTLLVELVDDRSDALPAICPLLARYDELAAARLQLQPPAGSTKPVRFVQCRAF
jgi:hypothetical protein